MRIERIVLDGFGTFNRGLEVALENARFSLVVGRNETGKSTLLHAIFGILFGFKDQNIQARFEPWEEHDAYAGELVVLTDRGSRIRIRRNFARGTARIEQEHKDEEDGSGWTLVLEGSANPRGSKEEDVAYFRKLGEILGFQDEAVFRNTVFVGQSSLQTSITEQIRRLISGSSSADYRGALHELHSRFAEITMRNPWRGPARSKPKLIERTEEQLLGDMERLEDGRTLLLRSVEIDEEIERIEDEILTTGEAKKTAESSLSRYEAYYAAKTASADADRRLEEALRRRDALRHAEERLHEVESRIKRGYRKFVRTREDFDDRIRTLISEEEGLAEERSALEQDRKKLETLKPVPNTKLGVLLAVIGLGAGLALVPALPATLGAGATVGVVAALIFFFVGRSIGTGYREAKAALNAVIARTSKSIASREHRIQEIRVAEADVIEDDDLEDLRSRYREYVALQKERAQKLSQVRSLGDKADIERSWSESALAQSHARTRLDEILSEAPYLADDAGSADLGGEIETMKRRVAELSAREAALERRHSECRIEQARLSGKMDFDLLTLEESVREKESRLADLEIQREALRAAIDTLDESVREYQEGDLHRLETEISSIFARITGDRYMSVKLSGAMEPTLERGDRVNIDPDSLSQGAKDQLYFAMRVAMARHLSRQSKLPFFLDDPFVNFDEERLKVTRELLGHLDDHQVIMVTCNRSYESWADKVLDMDRAADLAAAAERKKLS